ncbi:MAG: MotA/TolQ/ExbB proton channel family protein [bacterium]
MTTIIGIVFGSGLLFYSMVSSAGISVFIDAPSLMIVGGGTFASALISFSLPQVISVFGILKGAFGREIADPGSYISALVRLAHKARKESILSLQQDAANINNTYLKLGLQLVIDGQPPELVRGVLETEMESLLARHEDGAHIFKTMGRFSPAFGLIGTLIGLIAMLRSLAGGAEQLGPSMAIALITTFYGALASNLFFLPIAEKLSGRSETEVLQVRVVIEGVLMIQEGMNPRLLEQRLNAHLRPEHRIAHFERMLRREKQQAQAGG